MFCSDLACSHMRTVISHKSDSLSWPDFPIWLLFPPYSKHYVVFSIQILASGKCFSQGKACWFTAEYPSPKTVSATWERSNGSVMGKDWTSHLWHCLWSEAINGTHKRMRKLPVEVAWSYLIHATNHTRTKTRRVTHGRKQENKDSVDVGDCCFIDACSLNQPLSTG